LHHRDVIPGRAIAIPDPCLVVLVGPAGSGKSTFAARHFAADEVVSSDALRQAIAGAAADQSRNRAVFRALHQAVERRLADGRTAVVDATNVEAHARRPLVAAARSANVAAVAIVLDVPLDVVHARNTGRTARVVDPGVVERHHRRLATTLGKGRLEREGFQAVHIVTAAELDTVRIARQPSRPAHAQNA
jgi:protein phosphatase